MPQQHGRCVCVVEIKKCTLYIVVTSDTNFLSDFPPAVLNAGQGMSAESLKSKMEEKALIVKTTYW